ncbi:MAG: tetratricopeptide repeat protein [Chthoniobacterales bacterium]
MKSLLQLIVVMACALIARPLAAQSEDPSEVFLKAYMTSQAGEKLEHDNQLGTALSKFKSAGSLLETLKKGHGDWQPAIVEYRSRKISESILRVEGKLSTQKDLVASSDPGPVLPPILPGNGGPATDPSVQMSVAPVLPEHGGSVDGNVELVAPRGDARPTARRAAGDKTAAAPTDSAIKDTTKQLQSRVEQLEAELVKSKKDFTSVQKEKENLTGRLQETSAKLQKAQTEIEKAQQAEKEVRGQLAAAQESFDKIKTGGTAKAQEALRAEIAQLRKALASAEQGRAAAEKEKTDSDVKVASVTKERDQLLDQLKAGKQAQERVQVLVAENTALQQKLADVEKTFHDIGSDKPHKQEEVADVQRQVEQLRQQLVDKDKQNKEFEVTIADLRSQLDAAGSELNKAKLAGANPEETARLTRENEILRNIVLRERQEEARREQARKLMLAEFDKLQIKSETLNKQVALLAQPVTKLSTEELALLRQPIVAISDNNPGGMTASFAVPKQSEPAPAGQSKAEQTRSADSDSAVQTMPKPGVPDELVPVARDAKMNFDNGKYHSAERQYQQILAKAPNNLYALSNLGVVYFRTGKLKAAELTLKKAISLDSKDEFSHRTLGIVYYGEAKYDDAVTELTRALAINPKSFIAHNYLGITASQKGWQEAAEKEMNEAIAANPDYADAHYNLAVIYATAQPPSKEQAKLHYAKATSLGAEADPSLEKLLR